MIKNIFFFFQNTHLKVNAGDNTQLTQKYHRHLKVSLQISINWKLIF